MHRHHCLQREQVFATTGVVVVCAATGPVEGAAAGRQIHHRVVFATKLDAPLVGRERGATGGEGGGGAAGEGGRRGHRRMQGPDPVDAITEGRDGEGCRRQMQGGLIGASTGGRGGRRHLPPVRERSREGPGAADALGRSR